MNGIECSKMVTVAIEAGANGEMVELVKGQETALLVRVTPLVRNQSVTLDMSHVERIDAAGIAALITLYCTARQANHEFTVSHATPRVEEILALVGVRRLFGQDTEDAADYTLSLELAEA
jgi:anti-anti-sigma regulatory factor